MKKYSKILAAVIAATMAVTPVMTANAAWKIDSIGNIYWVYDAPPAENLFNVPASPELAFMVAARCPNLECYKAVLEENGYNFNDKELQILFEDYRERWIKSTFVPVTMLSPKLTLTTESGFEILPGKFEGYCDVADITVYKYQDVDDRTEILFSTYEDLIKGYQYLQQLSFVKFIFFDAIIADIMPEIDINGLVNPDVLNPFNLKAFPNLRETVKGLNDNDFIGICLYIDVPIAIPSIDYNISIEEDLYYYLKLINELEQETVLKALTPFVNANINVKPTDNDQIISYGYLRNDSRVYLCLNVAKSRIYDFAQCDEVTAIGFSPNDVPIVTITVLPIVTTVVDKTVSVPNKGDVTLTTERPVTTVYVPNSSGTDNCVVTATTPVPNKGDVTLTTGWPVTTVSVPYCEGTITATIPVSDKDDVTLTTRLPVLTVSVPNKGDTLIPEIPPNTTALDTTKVADYEYTTKNLIMLAKHLTGREQIINAATMADGAATAVVPYDVNGDSIINSDDLLLMIKILTGEYIR